MTKEARLTLIKDLDSASVDARVESLLKLATNFPVRHTDRVIRIALRDRSRVVRIMACHALRWGSPKAIATLAKIGGSLDEHVSVRAEAIEALSYHDAKMVPISLLLRALRDDAPIVRFFAAYSLGELGIVRATPALELVAERDKGRTRFGTVSKAANAALKQIAAFTRTATRGRHPV
ncbi:MAG: HEAT repeat domain-containing protein [Polyangiaceae bacterium]